jgi:calcineurin-like phosphoesterase family protein
MKILLYTDNHFAQYSSIVRGRGNNYSLRLENQIQTMNWIEKQAQQYNCGEVVCLGDFFDKPELNSEEITALKDIQWYGVTHRFIVGNHESNISSLIYNSTKALEGMTSFDIISKPKLIPYGKTDGIHDLYIMYIPYTLEENRKTIAGYRKELAVPEDARLIVLSHNDIKGIQYGAFLSKEGFDLKDIKGHCDLFINGHLHNGCFLGDDKYDQSMLNLGNVTGLNFSEDAFKYDHRIAILDTETLKLQFYVNPYAFNFYKIDIDKEEDLNKLNKLPWGNAVLTIRCEESLVDKLNEILKTNTQIISNRVIVYKKDTKVDGKDVSMITLNNVDHLKQFEEFTLNTLGNNDIVKEELGIICEGH